MGKSKAGRKDKADKQAARRHARGGGKASAADQEAAEAEAAAQVREVEARLQALTTEMKTVEASIRICTIEAKRAELTGKQLEPLGEDTKTYRQVGRAFLLQPKADLANSLRAQAAVKSLETQQLQQAHAKLEARMRSEANALREIVGPERLKQLFVPGPASASAEPAGEPGSVSIGGDGFVPLWGGALREAGAAGASLQHGGRAASEAATAGEDAGSVAGADGRATAHDVASNGKDLADPAAKQ